jgi:hypothetical protein
MTAGPGWIEASADVVVAERRLIRAALRVAEHDFAPNDQSSEGDYQELAEEEALYRAARELVAAPDKREENR